MSKVKPFRGYLPHPDRAKLVSSPPYDVLSSNEARYLAKENNISFLRIIKPEIDFLNNDEPKGQKLHEHAASNLNEFIKGGILLNDKEENFYIYQISMGEHIQTGIIGLVSVKEYNDSLIKKHEYTRPEKEDDRTCHIDTTNANTGPVFLTFRNDGGFQSMISKICGKIKDINFIAENNTVHSLWKIHQPQHIEMIKAYFESIPCLYIADGHHRAASASRVQALRENKDSLSNFFLGAIYPHDEMQILGYNRLAKDLAGLTSEDFISKIREKFQVTKLKQSEVPNRRYCFSMLLNKEWYRLEAKDEIIIQDSVLGLDASILQKHIMEPILKIDDPRTNDRIDFVGGIRGLKELERRCQLDAKVAFSLYAVTIDDLLKVSDEGKVMPPKSTWFEPKLRSGLVVRLLD